MPSSGGSTKAITIGWIHPLTGPLAGFGAPDNWVISKIKATTPYKNGFKIGGKTYPVTIKSYDTQSSVTRAGDLARTAILNDGVDLLLASSHAGDRQRRGQPGRVARHAAGLREHPVGVLVHQPAAATRPSRR